MRLLPNSTAVTAFRNEGPFVLEWVAWYRMLGFENILIVHNDCTDRSPPLLRLLEREGKVVQKKNRPDPAKPPQPQNFLVATDHRLVREADWVFVADADEFLVVHAGDHSVAALADEIDGKAIGMAVNWRIFGSSDEAEWEDTLVHRRFTRAARIEAQQNAGVKTFFKRPTDFKKLRNHGPAGWVSDEPWGQGDRMFILADGAPYPAYVPHRAPQNGTAEARWSNDLAQVNHYAVQTREQSAFTRNRPSPATFLNRRNDEFFVRFDRNEEENLSALAYREAFDAEHAALTAIPGAMRLHHLCCADYIGLMCEKRGDDPKQDRRWQMHMDTANSLPKHDS